jgi:hypothetical protein
MALPTAPPPLVTVQTQKHAVNWIARSGRQVTAVKRSSSLLRRQELPQDLIALPQAQLQGR